MIIFNESFKEDLIKAAIMDMFMLTKDCVATYVKEVAHSDEPTKNYHWTLQFN